MISYKPIVITSNRRRDGTFTVYVRVTFKGRSRRLPTSLVCVPGDLTRSGRIKNATLLSRAARLIDTMRDAVADCAPFELEGKDVDWVVNRIKDAAAGETFRLDFFDFGETVAASKSDRTRPAYTGALNALERYLGRRELDVNAVTRSLLLDFMAFVDGEKKVHYYARTGEMKEGRKEKISRGASSRHLMKLAHIFNAAKERYNDEDAGRILIPRSPFDNIRKHFPAPEGQSSLGRELMQRVISASPSSAFVRTALDAFVVSFGLMGANLADLYDAAPPEDGVWRYNRRKTSSRRADRARMQVTVPDELAPFLERLRGRAGSRWWLGELHRLAGEGNYCTQRVNKGLRAWCLSEGVPPFTFYAARHTWATLARKAGVEKATIDECLAHKGDFAVTDIYAERAWKLMDKANRTVLDLFRWD